MVGGDKHWSCLLGVLQDDGQSLSMLSQTDDEAEVDVDVEAEAEVGDCFALGCS